MDINNLKTVIKNIRYYDRSSYWVSMEVSNTLDDAQKAKFGFLYDTINVVGTFEGLEKGKEIILSGDYNMHPKYGKQIVIKDIKFGKDSNIGNSIIEFLTKSEIKGIKEYNAKKIYNKFGDKSLSVIFECPEKIKDVKGISKGTYEKVKGSYTKYFTYKDLIMYCTGFGVPFKIIESIHNILGEDALAIIKNDPYSILDKSYTLSFPQIDNIALKSKVADPVDTKRLLHGFSYYLFQTLNLEGSTGILSSRFIPVFKRSLGITNDMYFHSTMNKLIEDGKIIIENNIIYDKRLYDMEKYSSDIIKTMVNYTKECKTDFDSEIVEKAIKAFPFELNSQQKEAIRGCCKNRFSIITGPPGSGKSVITKAIVSILNESDMNVILLSPTGKATRRMVECTNHEASTIHKFLQVKESIEDAKVIDIPENSNIIVDESSMMDIILFSKLLACIKNSTRLILIGDNDQLPSVQAGNVLGDMIESVTDHTYKLTDIMRQAENSNIIKYCSEVNNGNTFKECHYTDLDYTIFFDSNELLRCLKRDYCKEVQDNNLKEVQVLTPYKKGLLGSINLNSTLNECVNINPKDEYTGYRLGDKVIQLSNNYKDNVFNGETGIIREITEDYVGIEFDNSYIDYEYKDLDQISLANVITVHKSQGSEYPVVFVIIDGTSDFLLIRKILYTAMSRGKKKVYIYSMDGLVNRCIENNNYITRTTKLKDFILGESNKSMEDEFDWLLS